MRKICAENQSIESIYSRFPLSLHYSPPEADNQLTKSQGSFHPIRCFLRQIWKQVWSVTKTGFTFVSSFLKIIKKNREKKRESERERKKKTHPPSWVLSWSELGKIWQVKFTVFAQSLWLDQGSSSEGTHPVTPTHCPSVCIAGLHSWTEQAFGQNQTRKCKMQALQLPTLAQSLDQTWVIPKEMSPKPPSADFRCSVSAVSAGGPLLSCRVIC